MLTVDDPTERNSGQGKNTSRTKQRNWVDACDDHLYRRNDPGGARTHDLLIKSQLLCQLSYRVANIVTRLR